MINRIITFSRVIIIGLYIGSTFFTFNPKRQYLPIITIHEVALSFLNKSAENGIKEALKYYNIQHPEIVYAQAILETGYFKSRQCLKHNNLFGLYNSRTKSYFKFNHWSESIKYYKEHIQNRYNPNENYYSFLKRIKYAEDIIYIDKLKQIVNTLRKKWH